MTGIHRNRRPWELPAARYIPSKINMPASRERGMPIRVLWRKLAANALKNGLMTESSPPSRYWNITASIAVVAAPAVNTGREQTSHSKLSSIRLVSSASFCMTGESNRNVPFITAERPFQPGKPGETRRRDALALQALRRHFPQGCRSFLFPP